MCGSGPAQNQACNLVLGKPRPLSERLRTGAIPRRLFLPFVQDSGRSAAWLARLVRDQEVDGSNPFAPTILFKHFHAVSGFSSTAL